MSSRVPYPAGSTVPNREARAVDGSVRAQLREQHREGEASENIRGQREIHRRVQQERGPNLRVERQRVRRLDAGRVPKPIHRIHAEH